MPSCDFPGWRSRMEYVCLGCGARHSIDELLYTCPSCGGGEKKCLGEKQPEELPPFPVKVRVCHISGTR